MEIQWRSHTLIYQLPASTEQDQQQLIAQGLAPLTEQADHWCQCTTMDDSDDDDTSDAPPALHGHSVVMYHTIRPDGTGWGSIAIDLSLTAILRMLEAPLRGSERDAVARERDMRDYVQQSGDCVVLIIYDWPQNDPAASHLIKQVIAYRDTRAEREEDEETTV